ncbi:hypothetical protein ABZS76_32780 [Streptomyces sp. NPDC005562]|uniref:hypothetical protein n=1 Tax=Streptomyces sp. NPDC005562 TaxID=3154890 RepID=UPI0033B99C03
MDPADLEQLLCELRSVNAETVTIPSEQVTPGCVIATGTWARHVVTAPPQPLSAKTLLTPVRHLHGGHDLSRRWSRSESVTIFRQRLRVSSIRSVPVVPRCFVPNDPIAGDRVFHHDHEVLRLGEGRFFEFDGSQWLQVTETGDGRRNRRTVRTFEKLRPVVSDPGESSPYGWYSYVPAGHRPHLYVDGAPMPARSVDELRVGDVIRLPGHGRLQVADLLRRPSSTTITVRVLQPSMHELRHFMWGRATGATGVHEDSGRTRSLYPTEARADELLTAADLRPFDTVITAWGAPYSAVAVVEDVWRQPVRAVMHVHSTGVDGRRWRSQTGLENRYVLLHRPQPCHDFAVKETLLPARSHA